MSVLAVLSWCSNTHKGSLEHHPLLHKFSVWILCSNHVLTETYYKPLWSQFPSLFCTRKPIALPWSVAQVVIKIAEEVLWNLSNSILLDIPLCVPMHARVPHTTLSIGAHPVCSKLSQMMFFRPRMQNVRLDIPKHRLSTHLPNDVSTTRVVRITI